MKLNKILMALSAMAIVGCSSEDFNDPSVTQAIDDSRLIQLDENFVLAGVGEVDNTTRTHWEWEGAAGKSPLINKFLPIWKTAPGGISTIDVDADLTAQAVGLCWLGQSVGTDVYTNYQFYHFGWLNKGEKKATFECNELTNGSLYNEIKVAAGDAAGDEADPTKFTPPTTKSAAGLNYNSGVYKTDNKAIFGGQYIVYYPYNENFKDAGTIPAIAETEFKPVSQALNTKEVGHATFRYSAPVTIEGGNQAADFGLKNLSTLVQLRVATPATVDLSAKEIDQIVLYSPSQKLLKQANLAADKIAAGKEGEDLYASTEGTKTISAKFATAVALQKTNNEDPKPTSAYITVLPTTVDDLVVLVHNSTDGKWARINMPNTVFKAGKAKRLDIIVTADDFKDDYIAVDQASLENALVEADKALAASTDENATATISVIGDITMSEDLGIYNTNTIGARTLAKVDKITIKGDDIIVPEGKTLTLNTNMESDIRVLGKTCCGTATKGGRLVVQGGMISNVTLEETEASTKNDDTNPELKYTTATATVAAGKTVDVKAGNVKVENAVQHKGDIKIAKGAKVTVNATGGLNFMGSNVTNDGTIEVEKAGNFNMTNSDGGATAAAGKRMTNNGTFIHNVDAAVGTAVQSMNQNGEYRCKVDEQAELADAYQKWSACSVIEIVAAPTGGYNLGVGKANIDYKHNGKYIDIEVNINGGGATTFNNTIGTNKGDDNEIMIGNLTVKKGGLDVDFVSDNGETDPAKKIYFKRTLTVNGDMTVAATTNLNSSKKINITKNLTVKGGATLTYKGEKKNEEGLAVTKDINVNGATFVAQEDALNITCANFYLKKVGDNKGIASFGNRTDGDAKNMVVSGTIDNPKGCEFNISAAGPSKLQAWVSCKELKVGGTFDGAQPQVVE